MIHPTSIVETQDIGGGTCIGPFCHISARVKIGSNCRLHSHCSIGAPPQYKVPSEDHGGIIVIGNNVDIREFVTINLPVNDLTYIGNNSCLQANVHIPHDAYLSDDVFVVVCSALAGFTKIGKGCYLSLNCSTHQHATLGDYCLLGANSFFRGDSPAGLIWAGVPARPIKVNQIALDNYLTNEDEKEKIISFAKLFIESYRRLG